MSNAANTATVRRLRNSKTNAVRFAVKVAGRRIGSMYRLRCDALDAAASWNARYSDAARDERARDDAQLLAALSSGALTLGAVESIIDDFRGRNTAERLVRRGLVTKSTRRGSRVINLDFLRGSKEVPTTTVTYTLAG